MSFAIVNCNVGLYLFHMDIRTQLLAFCNRTIAQKIDDIMWSLEYHIEDHTVEYFLYDYNQIRLLAIRVLNVESGIQKKCILSSLHEDTQNTCDIM